MISLEEFSKEVSLTDFQKTLLTDYLAQLINKYKRPTTKDYAYQNGVEDGLNHACKLINGEYDDYADMIFKKDDRETTTYYLLADNEHIKHFERSEVPLKEYDFEDEDNQEYESWSLFVFNANKTKSAELAYQISTAGNYLILTKEQYEHFQKQE